MKIDYLQILLQEVECMKDRKALRTQVIGWMLQSTDLPHVNMSDMLTYVSNLCVIFMLIGNTRGHARQVGGQIHI